MATSFAAIYVRHGDCEGEFVKAYFPIDVVDFFKGSSGWVYWKEYKDFFPAGVSPFQKESAELSLRNQARLWGDVCGWRGDRDEIIDFRGCSRVREV